MRILVKKLHEKAVTPLFIGGLEKSNWMDLHIVQVSVNGVKANPVVVVREGQVRYEVEYKAGDTVTLHTGLAMKLPLGYEGVLAPRSSTFKRTGLIQTNSIGVIDNAYCGNGDEWMGMYYATRKGRVEVYDRYMQFRVQKIMPHMDIEVVDDLKCVNRGGFGSTNV